MNAFRGLPRYGSASAIPIALSLICHAATAADRVDWLEFVPGGTAPAFSLQDDSGAAVVGGTLAVQRGAAFSGFPSARNFAGPYWKGDTGFSDSMSGDQLLHATAFRVAAGSGGPASYIIEFGIPEGRELLLMVGDLYHGSDISRTAGVSISAFSDSEAGAISLEGIWGWDNGVTRMSDDLAWTAGIGLLSTVSGGTGESKAAFFRIAPLNGANAKLRLSVPDGLAGTGDAIMVALGVAVPEPSAAMLCIAGGLGMVLRRKRR